jgi:hypothetical protein
MPQYLVAIQHPENYDPSLEGEAMIRDIGALNEQMDAAGARFFAGGLESPRHAKSLRKQPDGNLSRQRLPPPRSQGTHRRFLDSRVRRHTRSSGLGTQSRRRLSRYERSSKSGRIENHSLTETRNEKAQNVRTHLAGRCNPGSRGRRQ